MNTRPIKVSYTSRAGNGRRRWDVVFDLGSRKDNMTAALKYAWDFCARIDGYRPVLGAK